ncbi:tRNA threonylcarbamoyladenosine dehydratase [Lachnospiraceae bacterium 62-35]
MNYEFSRTELLLGRENMERLAASKVIVFGTGGVGSHCIEALARSGIGSFLLVDSDDVSITNLNRQALAFHCTVGKRKTDVMKEIILQINPSAHIFTCEDFILSDNLEQFFHSAAAVFGRSEDNPADYLIDAIDTISAKIAIAEYAFSHSIPLISSMGTGNKLHPEQFEIADIYQTSVCPLCRIMRKELKTRKIPSLKVLYSREQPLKPLYRRDSGGAGEEIDGIRRPVPGSVSFVPPVAGLLIAGEVIRNILELD